MEMHALAPRATLAMPHPYQLPPPAPAERERYGAIEENGVRLVAQAPVSTFSIDVDTGSYSNMRRMLNAGRVPPADAVRVEELLNYFPYDYAQPGDGRPFAVHAALAPAPGTRPMCCCASASRARTWPAAHCRPPTWYSWWMCRDR